MNEESKKEGLSLTQPILPDVNEVKNETISDGIKIIPDDSLENYTEKSAEQEESSYNLTSVELKKLLRLKLKNEEDEADRIVTDEMVENLTKEEIIELEKLAKLRDRKNLIKYVNKVKTVTDEEADALTTEEFLELTNKAIVMSRHLKYQPKKNFGVAYKKKRQNKNKIANRSRVANRN